MMATAVRIGAAGSGSVAGVAGERCVGWYRVLWQSKGQGFESPQLHSCGCDGLYRVSAAQGLCWLDVVDLYKIDYSRGLYLIWSKSGARRPEGSKCCQRLLQTFGPVRPGSGPLNASRRRWCQAASAASAAAVGTRPGPRPQDWSARPSVADRGRIGAASGPPRRCHLSSDDMPVAAANGSRREDAAARQDSNVRGAPGAARTASARTELLISGRAAAGATSPSATNTCIRGPQPWSADWAVS